MCSGENLSDMHAGCFLYVAQFHADLSVGSYAWLDSDFTEPPLPFYMFTECLCAYVLSGIYGSQGRDDYDLDDVEHYFNYMGLLAVLGTYDKLQAMIDTGNHPADIILQMVRFCT